MAGPFPGMDPYIESQGNWQDFHNRLISEMCNSLGVRLPEDYLARVDESIEVVGFADNAGTAYRPTCWLLGTIGRNWQNDPNSPVLAWRRSGRSWTR